jgi:hypothetical protein
MKIIYENNTEKFETVRYNIIKLLKEYPQTRNSDKLLLEKYYLIYEKMNIPLSKVKANPITIWRSRQKVQELNPNLRANEKVQDFREINEEIYREEFGDVDVV